MEELTILLIGDSGCGKTLLAHAFNGTPPPSEYSPTVGVDFSSWEFSIDDFKGYASVWDLPGSERLASVSGGRNVLVDMAILLYDVTTPATLSHLSGWLDEFLQTSYCGPAPPAVFVVGCNVRQPHHQGQMISEKDAVSWCRSISWPNDSWPTTIEPVPHVLFNGFDGRAIKELVLDRAKFLRTLKLANLPQWTVSPPQHGEFNLADVCIRTSVVFPEKDKDGLLSVTLPKLAETEPNYTDKASHILRCSLATTQGMLDVHAGTVERDLCFTSAGAHVSVFIVRLRYAAITAQQVLQWFESAKLATLCVEPTVSVAFVCIGITTAGMHVDPDTSPAVSTLCGKYGINYVEMFDTITDDILQQRWSELAEYSVTVRRDAVLQRVAAAGPCELSTCPEQHHGCQWLGRKSDQKAHHTVCGHVFEKCRFYPCEVFIKRAEREHHESLCIHRTSDCHFCKCAFVGRLEDHLEICEKKKYVDSIAVQCPFADFECPQPRVQKDGLRDHVQTMLVEHTMMSGRGLQSLRRQISQTETAINVKMDAMHAAYKAEITTLREALRRSEEREEKLKEELKDVRLELRVMWEAIEKRNV